MEKCLDTFIIDVNSLLEISDRHVVVLHILVDETPLDVDGLIFWKLLHHPLELVQSILEFTRASKHQPLVEHRRNKRLVTR